LHNLRILVVLRSLVYVLRPRKVLQKAQTGTLPTGTAIEIISFPESECGP